MIRWTRCRVARLGLVWAFVVLSAPSIGAAPEPVRLATHDQAPYGSVQPDQSFDGIAVRVVRCVFRHLNRPVSIEVYPWERAQVLAEKGQVDGFFPATLKPERLQWAEATQVIADQKWVWYLPQNSTLDPLSGEFKATARVGAHFGSNRLKMLEAEKFNVVLKPQTDEALLLAFVAGRADAVLGGDQAMAEAMRIHKVDASRLRTVVLQDNPLYAYFGRKFLKSDPDLVKQFNKYLSACR